MGNLDTVDGQNPAPVDMVNIPLFIGFHTSQVVQDFSHQQYGDVWQDFIAAAVRPRAQTLGHFESRGKFDPCWENPKVSMHKAGWKWKKLKWQQFTCHYKGCFCHCKAQIPFNVCILIHVLSYFNHGALLDSKVANPKHNGFRCRVRLQARLTSHGIPHLKMVWSRTSNSVKAVELKTQRNRWRNRADKCSSSRLSKHACRCFDQKLFDIPTAGLFNFVEEEKYQFVSWNIYFSIHSDMTNDSQYVRDSMDMLGICLEYMWHVNIS